MNFPKFNTKNMSIIVDAINDHPNIDNDNFEVKRINFFMDKEGPDCPYLMQCMKLFYLNNPNHRKIVNSHAGS